MKQTGIGFLLLWIMILTGFSQTEAQTRRLVIRNHTEDTLQSLLVKPARTMPEPLRQIRKVFLRPGDSIVIQVPASGFYTIHGFRSANYGKKPTPSGRPARPERGNIYFSHVLIPDGENKISATLTPDELETQPKVMPEFVPGIVPLAEFVLENRTKYSFYTFYIKYPSDARWLPVNQMFSWEPLAPGKRKKMRFFAFTMDGGEITIKEEPLSVRIYAFNTKGQAEIFEIDAFDVANKDVLTVR